MCLLMFINFYDSTPQKSSFQAITVTSLKMILEEF